MSNENGTDSRHTAGILLGVFLGIIGIVIAAVLDMSDGNDGHIYLSAAVKGFLISLAVGVGIAVLCMFAFGGLAAVAMW